VFGPYVGIGLSGKMKGEVSIDGETTSQEIDIEWGSDIASSDLKRMDFGLIIGAGVELNSIQIGLNYSLGLANISPQTNVKIRNRVLGISVGYRFGKKRKLVNSKY
jgi:outer membrane protein W